MKRIAILIAFGGLTFFPSPAGAAPSVDCRQACNKAVQACVDACGSTNLHGLSARRCRAACKNPRVKSTCNRLCRTTGVLPN